MNIKLVEIDGYQLPQVRENTKHEWVEWGDANLYFDWLITLYKRSTTNNACIDGAVKLMYGQGLMPVNPSRDIMAYQNLRSMSTPEDIQRITFDSYQFGMAAVKIMLSRDKTRITEAKHWPMQTIRMGKANKDGEIERVFYCPDWSDVKMVKEHTQDFPIWTGNPEDGLEYFMIIRTYSPGSYYYSEPPYMGAVEPAAMQMELTNFYLNFVSNGMYPGLWINMNNGVPDEKTQKDLERKIKRKMSGTDRAGRFLLSFNDGKETSAEVQPIQLQEAPATFEHLSKEAKESIMQGHKITSPLLIGIRDGGGLGSNKDELRTSFYLYRDYQIEPLRTPLIEAFEGLLMYNGAYAQLMFKDLDTSALDEPQTSQNTPATLRKFNRENPIRLMDVDDKSMNTAWNWLATVGEDPGEEWEEIESGAVDYDMEDAIIARVEGYNLKMARAVHSNPERTSDQDTSLFKIRYRYSPPSTHRDSRDFCKKMVSASKVYRKEDIEAASDRMVNPGFGPNGTDKYSIWLYKGGARCHHFWERVIYMRKNNKKISSVNEARRIIRDLDPDERKDARWDTNDPKVAKRPTDMPNEGFLNPPK